MIRKLLSYLGEYQKYAILTPSMIIGEVVMEVLIPFVMAAIIDHGLRRRLGAERGFNHRDCRGLPAIDQKFFDTDYPDVAAV
jgi:hypothetical protein